MNKRKIILIIISMLIIVWAFSLIDKEEKVVENPINIEIGQEFTGVEYSQKKYILNYKIADLNGDSTNDVVIFVGEKETPDAENVKNADIVYYDGALQKYVKADLKKFDGDSPRIEMADLTGDSLNDIIAILNNDNQDKSIRILTLTNESLKEIFKAIDNKYINFVGSFVDGFKVNIQNKKLNINKDLNLSNSSKSFIENGVFDDSGRCKISENFNIKTTGFVEIEFVQLTGNMGLKTKQKIITSDNKNIIDEISIVWKYEDGKWQIKEATGLKLGNLLY